MYEVFSEVHGPRRQHRDWEWCCMMVALQDMRAIPGEDST